MAELEIHLSIDELLDIVGDIAIVRYTAVSTLALLITDYFYTFEQERRYVWPSKLTIPKVIFFLNRYLPFIGTTGVIIVLVIIPPQDLGYCRQMFLGFGSIVTSNYIIAEFILYMRAYAIWRCGTRMLIFCVTVLTGTFTFGLYISGIFLGSARAVDLEGLHGGCIIEFRRQVDWIAFIALIVTETTALVLLVIKARQLRASPIMKVMFNDGINYYVFIVATTVANVVILRSASPTLCNFMLATQAALHSIFCNRILLNIRGVYESIDESFANLTTLSAVSIPHHFTTFSRVSHQITKQETSNESRTTSV